MTFFVTFPDAICLEVMISWSDVKTLGRIDSAFCNKPKRSRLLEIFKGEGFALEELSGRYSSFRALNWLRMRGIHLKKLKIYGDEITFLPTSRITSLSIFNHLECSISKHDLIKLINGCPRLKSLVLHDVESCDDATVSLFSSKVLSQLTEVDFTPACRKFTSLSLSKLATCCSNIYRLNLSALNVNEETILTLLERNRKMKFLKLSNFTITDALLHGVMKYNRHLSEVYIVTGTIVYDIVAKMITQCPALTCAMISGTSIGSFTYKNKHGKSAMAKTVEIQSSSVANNTTTESLVSFFNQVKGFEEVIFYNVRGLSSEVLAALANGSQDTLAVLCVNYCGTAYTCQALDYVLSRCANLRVLKLFGANRLSNNDYLELFNATTALGHLAAHHGEHEPLPQTSLQGAATRAQDGGRDGRGGGIEEWIMWENKIICTETVVRVMDANKQMRVVSFTGCHNVAKEEVLTQLALSSAGHDDATPQRDIQWV